MDTVEEPDLYWQETRRPLASLCFLLPWILVYEAGILMLAGDQHDAFRNGADYWLRSLLNWSGASGLFLLPLLVVGTLLVWHWVGRHPWRYQLETQLGMLAESVVFGVTLVAVGQLHQLVFLSLSETPQAGLSLSTGPLTLAVSFVGAGVYEEVLFRLLLLPLAYGFFRLFEFPAKPAAVMAAISTAFVFAMAHHVGVSADPFSLFAFSFRAAAGVFFAAVFFTRGFGITAGCHMAYDLLVGLILSDA